MSDDNLGTPRRKKEVESEDLSHQSLKNESNEGPFAHVAMKVLGYPSEDVGDLAGWMMLQSFGEHCSGLLL